jgi:hypothetical protein
MILSPNLYLDLILLVQLIIEPNQIWIWKTVRSNILWFSYMLSLNT